MSNSEANRPSIEEMIDALEAVRDRARVQAHLFSLEARERWDALETTLLALESKLESGGHDVAANLSKKFHESVAAAKQLLREVDGRD
jgi:hypothetical protein